MKSNTMDVSRTPFFTVIIPTFNRRELLKGAVQCVLEQSFNDFELIVVDDHSTDSTRDVVHSFQDGRVKYVLNDRTKGLSGARNAGISRANGHWVAFLDDDDVWLPWKLEYLHNKIHEVDDATGLVYTGYANYDFDRQTELSLSVPSKEGWIKEELLYKNYIGTPSAVAIRADILKKIGGCDEKLVFFEDCDLYVRVAELCKVAFVMDSLTRVRISNSDRLSFKYERRVKGYKQFRDKHRETIRKHPKLQHRAASRIFVYAYLLRDKEEMMKALPWTLFGLFVDIPNLVRVVWRTVVSSNKMQTRANDIEG